MTKKATTTSFSTMNVYRELKESMPPDPLDAFQKKHGIDLDAGDMMVVPAEFAGMATMHSNIIVSSLVDTGITVKASPLVKAFALERRHFVSCPECNPDGVAFEEAAEHYGENRIFCEERECIYLEAMNGDIFKPRLAAQEIDTSLRVRVATDVGLMSHLPFSTAMTVDTSSGHDDREFFFLFPLGKKTWVKKRKVKRRAKK